MRQSHFKLISIIILVCLGVTAYSNTFDDPFHFDDDRFIAGNASIRNIFMPLGIWKLFPTRFMAFLTFSANYHFHQFRVFGYHLVNLAIHLSSAIAVFWFISLLFLTPALKTDEISKHSRPAALFASLIFLTHPLQTESVTYIYQRLTSLAGFFYIISVSLYIKSRILRQNGAEGHKWAIFYILSLAAGIFGMFTKENTFTLPLAVFLAELYFFTKGKRIDFRYAAPFLLILPVIPATLLILKPYTFVNIHDLYQQPAMGWLYFLTQSRVMLTYIRLLFVPVKQNLDYDFPVSNSLLEWPTIAAVLLLACVIFIAVRLFPKYRLVSFGIVFFFLTLSVESSVIPLEAMFEHRLYLPMAGFSIFAVSGLYYLWRRKNILALYVLFCLLVAFYTVLTYSRNMVWGNEITLWSDAIRKSPGKAGPYVNRGIALVKNKQYDKAIADFNKALELNPHYAQAHNALGYALLLMKEYDRAISCFNQALSADPYYTEAYINLGVAFGSKKEYKAAISELKRALILDANSFDARMNLAKVYAEARNFSGAIEACRELIKKDPFSIDAYNTIALAYGELGQDDESIKYLNTALRLNPDHAQTYANLGAAYGRVGRLPEAIDAFRRALELDPDSPVAHNNIAVAYYYAKQYDLAYRHCDKAIQLGFKVDPEFLGLLRKRRAENREGKDGETNENQPQK